MRAAPSLIFGFAACAFFLIGESAARSAEIDSKKVLAPVSERFAEPALDESPDFQRHVVPLLGRVGCNGRACHGSFKGQGGFQLSLFGYDFESDHEQMTGEDYSRIDRESPRESMVLQKPTLQMDHDGGEVITANSWQYNLLSRWIEQGAKELKGEAELTRLEVTPDEIVSSKTGEEIELRVVAVWSDGSTEDVTPLCRFQTNDPTVAAIDEHGSITIGESGDTHVVVFYDSAVRPIPVIKPFNANYGSTYPTVQTKSEVDQLVVQKLRKLGIVPSELAGDADFLRRVQLDLTGTLPAAWEVEAFLSDDSPNKRSEKIEELMQTPAYAAWWATKLCDMTGNNPASLNNEVGRDRASEDWFRWIEKRVAENRPYDELVEGIVLAVSREDDESYADYCEAMSDIYRVDAKADFADRSTMPHYWARRTFTKPEDRAIGFAYAFLGVRIQCAQCHKHPFDQWTQTDFKNFEAFFTGVTYNVDPKSKKEYQQMLQAISGDEKGNAARQKIGSLLLQGEVVPLREVYAETPAPALKNKKQNQRRRNRTRVAESGRVLGGEEINFSEAGGDIRKPLMDWLRSKDNKYFARAFVNRVWANYFNRGIVEPPDDLSLANAPVNGPLLDYLADGFIERGYDMKWLHREITNSDTYQRSWRPNETNASDESNFSRAVHRRLPAEVAVDALAFATAADDRVRALKESNEGRAIAVPGAGQRSRAITEAGNAGFAFEVFGRSIRESNCDCDRSADPSVLQTIFLRNDNDLLKRLEANGDTWIAQLKGCIAPGAADRQTVAERRILQIKKQIDREQAKLDELTAETEQDTKQIARSLTRLDRLHESLADSESRVAALKRAAQFENRLAKATPETVIREAYLRTLSRYPTDNELEVARGFFNNADGMETGARDLMWALLNTKEFIINH
ncbi:DUF1549 and DUF1553 domain-containing protein [Stratiformator vulcanicus]|uniref:BIG2 domain-containing protein n=1 Tax=Stratiformator vulcanicus TaxID=2527980 RepID=A0A517QZK5_9PLAN|nr:DUF1549 and DUF1553 domain-containing protein [Stratiformator vulcanicus]QDT37076.1 hypothetical protein Pan189_14430 [Stratiformator vulcanicus]